MNIPDYVPGGKHVSSSIGRFVNYFGEKPKPEKVLDECALLVGEPCTIINGTDDWNHPHHMRPQSFVPTEMVVAWFHTGISGITRSGCVVRSRDVPEIRESYAAKFPDGNWSWLQVLSKHGRA